MECAGVPRAVAAEDAHTSSPARDDPQSKACRDALVVVEPACEVPPWAPDAIGSREGDGHPDNGGGPAASRHFASDLARPARADDAFPPCPLRSPAA